MYDMTPAMRGDDLKTTDTQRKRWIHEFLTGGANLAHGRRTQEFWRISVGFGAYLNW